MHLSKKQLECLIAFGKLLDKHGTPPTKREVAAEMGLTEDGARLHLLELARKGCLEEEKKLVTVSRKLTPLGKSWIKRSG